MVHQDIHAHRILILDFGSQYTQLIARRVRITRAPELSFQRHDTTREESLRGDSIDDVWDLDAKVDS